MIIILTIAASVHVICNIVQTVLIYRDNQLRKQAYAALDAVARIHVVQLPQSFVSTKLRKKQP